MFDEEILIRIIPTILHQIVCKGIFISKLLSKVSKIRTTISKVSLNPYAGGGFFFQIQNGVKRTFKMTETLAHGYSSECTLRELSNEYQHDRV